MKVSRVGEGTVVNLVVHIPHRDAEPESSALNLAQRAPTFTTEWLNQQRVSVAIFSSLPRGIDLAVQLIGAAIHIEGAWASVNAKPVSSLTKLWQRLDCYRSSLGKTNPKRYCQEKSALFNTLVGCEHHLCPVPCQFICTPCMRMEQEGATVSPANRFKVAAELAEIDWCPNLRLLSQEEDRLGISSNPVRLSPASS
jgi:hypothetical protein